MSSDNIEEIKKNVIQGRVTSEDEGFEEGMAGQPGVKELIEQALESGVDISKIINQGLTASMEEVGQKFEKQEYCIPDMLASATAVGAAMELLEPHLEGSGVEPKAKILFATVKGDLHDIGKNIVSILLRGAGYTVIDLGNDKAPQDIVSAVREQKPKILALSALLTSTMVNMKETVDALKEAGLRDTVKIIIGGAPVTQEYADEIGVDAYGADGFHAVTVVEAINKAN